MSYVCANNVIFVYRFVESLNLTKNIIETNDLFVIELYATMPFFFLFVHRLFVHLFVAFSFESANHTGTTANHNNINTRTAVPWKSIEKHFRFTDFPPTYNTTIQFTDKGNQSYNFFYDRLFCVHYSWLTVITILDFLFNIPNIYTTIFTLEHE